jgi:hypothetical protein
MIPHVERDAEAIGDSAGIAGVLDRAAASGGFAQGRGGLREGEMDADDLVTGLDHARGGDGGVHAPAHRGDDAQPGGHRAR